MKDREFESILDECLAALAAGRSLEECLARHPQHAARLRPLLEMAARVAAVTTPEPSLASQAAGRQRFLTRAAVLRQARERRRPFLLRPLAAAAALAILLLVGTGFTAGAATRSQPDSPLYPLKLRLEDARLWFPFGQGERLDARLDRVERRLNEVRWLLEHDKPVGANVLSELRQEGDAIANGLAANPNPALVERARALYGRQREVLAAAWERVPPQAQGHFARAMANGHNGLLHLEGRADGDVRVAPEEVMGGVARIEGLVEARQGDLWRLGGARVVVGRATLVEGDGTNPVGRRAAVTVARGADGSLHALRVVVQDPGAGPTRFTLRGSLEETSGDRLRIGGRLLPLGPNAVRLGRLGRDQIVEVRGVVVPDGRIHIEAVRALPPGLDRGPFTYEGLIESSESRNGREYWQISGQRFLVSGAFIDAQRQPYTVGARVRIEAERRGDELVAQRILVLPGRGREGALRLEGVVQPSVSGVWAVAGIPVVRSDGSPGPPPGTYVQVVGRLAPQGGVVADEVTALPPDTLRLEGVVQRIDDRQWLVAGLPVALDQGTQVVGVPAAGAQVVVWGGVGPDGRWTARYVDVLDSATSR